MKIYEFDLLFSN